MNSENMKRYRKHYSESGLWKKLSGVARKAGSKVVYAALLLYYVLMDKNTPDKYKATIIGALGYFILPLDIIPDAIPLLGFSDDLTALIAGVKAVCDCITPDLKRQAIGKMCQWFGHDIRTPDLPL